MKKRAVSIMLCAAMLAGTLGGCGSSNTTKQTTDAGTTAMVTDAGTQAETAAKAAEPDAETEETAPQAPAAGDVT